MILPFSIQINGKPTYFVEKIHSGLLQNNLLQGFDLGDEHEFDLDKLCSCEPKLHTIREDKNGRWKSGNNIHFFINNRTKNAFRFAPVLPVVSTQRIFMTYAWSDIIEISIDGRQLHNHKEIIDFIQNDGFDTWDDFFNYFFPIIQNHPDECFSGKIIHWTDLRY